MTDYFIGIDIGTGSTKAVAVDAQGKTIGSEQVSYPTLQPKPGYSEQAPELIWQAFVKCVRRIVTDLEGPPAGIALSSAMHSLIAMDAHGKPLMNMVIWADNRSSEIAVKVKQSSSGEMLYEQTGMAIHAMSPLCKIIWLKENEPILFQKVDKFISIKEYIWFKLFGVFEVDHSIASGTGLFDIEKLCWSENALQRCEITADRLSTLVNTSYQQIGIQSALAVQLGIPQNTCFIIGASDGCLANLGSFATEPGIAALTIGTSGAIRVGNTKPTYNFDAMTFNYRLDEQTIISGGAVNNGGIVLKWYAEKFLQKKLNDSADYASILSEIENINSGSDGLIFLPYLLGERAPIWNSEACGVFLGITIHHTQAHFTKAVVEGISLALYNVSRTMEESGLSINQINVSGGFIHSESWLQLLADIFGEKIVLISTEDASARGAAYLGMKKINMIKDYQSLMPTSVKTFYPNQFRHVLYAETILPVYRNLTRNLLPDMAALHELKKNLQQNS